VRKTLLAAVSLVAMVASADARAEWRPDPAKASGSFGGQCARVVVPPGPLHENGFDIGKLNLRDQPNTKARVRFLLNAQDIVVLSIEPAHQFFKDWVLVNGRVFWQMGTWTEETPPVYIPGYYGVEDYNYGWVSKKYLNPVRCPIEDPKPPLWDIPISSENKK
jgi:hypothetical protein